MENTDETKRKFAEIMQGLAENFGGELSRPGLKMRFELLKPYPIEAVEQMALRLLATRKFTRMPTVAEMLDFLGDGSVEDRAEIEAAKVLKAIGDVGGYQSVVFDDPVTMAVIHGSYGGWRLLCAETSEADTRWFRQQFAKTYGAYARRDVKVFGHLPGQLEIDEAGRAGDSERLPRPVLIGDRAKAQAVLEAGENRDRVFLEGPKSAPVAVQAALEGALRRAPAGTTHQ